MSTFAAGAQVAERMRGRRVDRVLPALFGATILASACLLFLVQPLVSKLILPWFGGSSAVWITCLLFFQAGLLLGYLYAHVLTHRVSTRRQTVIHAGLLVVSLGTLPILPNARWQPAPGQDPTWLVFGALAAAAGLPYVLLSSTTPLLQSWYAQTNSGALPYRYFALSNTGSLVALLGYPILVEPYLTGHRQAWMWSLAFAAFAVLCVGVAVLATRKRAELKPRAFAETNGRTSRVQMLLWVSLAACASTLLLAVTNLLTQNIAPMPLLWVLPLSIYLLTFILCFESERWYKRVLFLPLMLPALGCLVAGAGPLSNQKFSVVLPLLCAALFVCCMPCHGELARAKPPARQLTAFYLCLAAGGALGGLFVAVVAPHFFNAMYEYPVAFVSCAVLLLIVLWRERRNWKNRELGFALWMGGLAATFLLSLYGGLETWRNLGSAVVLERNFYGALRVQDVLDRRNRVRELTHGTITHGVQFRNPGRRNVPTTYYGRDSGIGLTWQVLERTGPLRMGVVGLGAGTLAAYGRGGDTLRFYEINPLVVGIAKTRFTFLADCPAHNDVVLGDARLSMAHEASRQFDILVIDAFSGDAIPVHLLTREAFAMYWRHLKPDGVLAVHVSNRFLNLAPVVMLAATEFGKQAWRIDNYDDDAQEVYSASYVVVTSRRDFFSNSAFRGQLSKIEMPPHLRTWTDDYSNLWQILNYK